jgi:hypothetical protein
MQIIVLAAEITRRCSEWVGRVIGRDRQTRAGKKINDYQKLKENWESLN